MTQVSTNVSIFTVEVNNTDCERSSRVVKNHHDPTEFRLPWKIQISFPNQDSSDSFLKYLPYHHAQATLCCNCQRSFPDLPYYASCTSRNVATVNDVTSQCTSARLQKIHVQCIQFKLEPNNRLYASTAWRKAHVITALLYSDERCHPVLSQCSVLLSHVTKCFCITKCTFWCSTISLHEPECSPQASCTTDMQYHITRPMYHRVRPKRPPATHSCVSSSVHSPVVLTNGACRL